jgi:hypothetical protein
MVAPFMINADNPLYSVNGVLNGILVKGDVIGDVMFYGAGAGKYPTASAVVADIVDEAKHLHTNIMTIWSSKKLSLESMNTLKNKFFVRIDGSVDKSGYKRRWYQCQGEVNGSTLKVKSVEDEDGNIRYLWGGVFPNSPKDGESIMGRYTEYRFAVTETADKPSVSDYVNGEVNRNPIYYNNRNIACGWFTTSESLPDIPEGGAQWMINAIVDGQTDELISQNGKYWSSPLKISGEKGEKGEQGPTGLRGTTGIPGASQKALYCLGIDSNSGEYYFIGNDEDSVNLYNEKLILSGMSSGYFG